MDESQLLPNQTLPTLKMYKLIECHDKRQEDAVLLEHNLLFIAQQLKHVVSFSYISSDVSVCAHWQPPTVVPLGQ